MKRIGLISDTHGTFDQTLKTFLKDVDEIWHAGDISGGRRPDRGVQTPAGRLWQYRRRYHATHLPRISLLRVRRGERPDDPHRRLSPPLHPAGRSADPIAAPENLHRGALPHSTCFTSTPALPAATVSTRCAAPCASPSTAPTSATWKSANGLVPALDKGTKSFNMQYFYLT